MNTRNTLAAGITAVATGLSLLTFQASAQQQQPKPAVTTPSAVLGLGEIESRLAAEGITIRELEVKDNVVEVEGRDAQGREVELVIDRRSGEILSRRFDR